MSEPQFDREAWNEDLQRLMEKHGIRQMVVLYRHGTSLRSASFADNSVDGAAADALYDIVSAAVETEDARVKVRKAAEDAFRLFQQERN